MQNLLGLFWIYKFLAYDAELAGFKNCNSMMQNLLRLFWVYELQQYDAELAGIVLGVQIATIYCRTYMSFWDLIFKSRFMRG